MEVNLGSLTYIKQDDFSVEQYEKMMRDNLNDVIDKCLNALEEIEKEKKRVAKAYNKTVRAKLFQVGDLVWKTILLLVQNLRCPVSGHLVGKVHIGYVESFERMHIFLRLYKENGFK